MIRMAWEEQREKSDTKGTTCEESHERNNAQAAAQKEQHEE
jgi:hypothetical protein